jgi:AraC family transcriptional regulator
MADLHRQPLFRGDLLSITDFRCREPEAGCQDEEHAVAHELVFIRAGLFVKHSGKRRIVADPTQTLFFNKDEGYRVSHPGRSGDDCTVLSFSSGTVIEVLQVYDPFAGERDGSLFRVSHLASEPRLMWQYHHLRRGLREGWITPLEAEETGLGVLASSLGTAYGSRPASAPIGRRANGRSREIVEAVQLRLASRPGARHTLSELAREVACSPFHLTRLFRDQVGIPVHRCLIRLRLATVLERLAEGQENLSALAYELGFSSHSHLTRLFRQVFGAVPSSLVTSAARLRSIRSACRPIDLPRA